MPPALGACPCCGCCAAAGAFGVARGGVGRKTVVRQIGPNFVNDY